MQELERYTDKEIMIHTTVLLRASTNTYDHFHNDIISGLYYLAHLLANITFTASAANQGTFSCLTVTVRRYEGTAHCTIVM